MVISDTDSIGILSYSDSSCSDDYTISDDDSIGSIIDGMNEEERQFNMLNIMARRETR